MKIDVVGVHGGYLLVDQESKEALGGHRLGEDAFAFQLGLESGEMSPEDYRQYDERVDPNWRGI